MSRKVWPVAKITHYEDGRVVVINLSTGDEESLEPGTYVIVKAWATSGCLLPVLVALALLAVLL